MSTINTNSIDINYPIPGINNSTQGFRDNFTSVKQNLDIASTEISDLQNKVVVKSALAGTVLNNDMANTLISNAAVQGFRAKTYNMGSNLGGTVTIDVSKADVQYGTVTATGTTTLAFGGWAPSGTQSNVQIRISVDPNVSIDETSYLLFPSTDINSSGNIVAGLTSSARILENYASNVADANVGPDMTYTNVVSLTGMQELDFTISTIDCGTILEVTPINKNQKAGQIPIRIPTATGEPGDWPGKICMGNQYLYVCTGAYDGSTAIWVKVNAAFSAL